MYNNYNMVSSLNIYLLISLRLSVAVGEEITIEAARALRTRRTLAFLECETMNKNNVMCSCERFPHKEYDIYLVSARKCGSVAVIVKYLASHYLRFENKLNKKWYNR